MNRACKGYSVAKAMEQLDVTDAGNADCGAMAATPGEQPPIYSRCLKGTLSRDLKQGP
jgi:hypothetical protein